MQKFKVNIEVFLRQQYCSLFLVQYLREISHEDTLKKLLDGISIEVTFQRLIYKLGGLEVWFSVVVEHDNPRLKFRSGSMNDLAGEMQNFNLKLD